LQQIKASQAAGLPEGVVLMDAGYGNDTELRTQLTAVGLRHVPGIGPNTSVWPPGTRCRHRPVRYRATTQIASTRRAASADLGESIGSQPTDGGLADHYLARGHRGLAVIALCRQRVRPANRDTELREPGAEEWLLIE
jgi:hypothetical protein